MLALLLALLPAGARADAAFGSCPSGTGGKSLDLCLGSLKGLTGPRPLAPPPAIGALPPAGAEEPAPQAGPGWSISGTLVPDLSDSKAPPSPDADDAERLLQSLRLKQFMLRLSRPF